MKRAVILCGAIVLDAVLLTHFWQTNQLASLTQLIQKNQEIVNWPCAGTIRYRIDEIDPEFQLSNEELMSDASAAAQLWNSAEGRKLFVYDPQGELSVNMIFDGRQQLSTEINKLQSTVQSARNQLDPKEAAHQAAVAAYQQKADALKAEIDSWNAKGGATPDVADQLNAERATLQQEADRLNAEAVALNQQSANFNVQVGTLNNTVNIFNTQLTQKPEEGLFLGDQDRIEIYFNNNKQELIHTLAHEMGHALGMNHVDDKKAIMYASSNQNTRPSAADLAELKNTCQDDVVRPIN